MSVVQFSVAREPAPTLLTFYLVRSFWADRERLVEGKLEQFMNMESALRAGQRAAVKSAAVLVQRVRGNVEADYWEARVTIARYGDALALAPSQVDDEPHNGRQDIKACGVQELRRATVGIA